MTQCSRVVGARIAIAAALACGLLLAQFATSDNRYATYETVYAIDLTPTPTTTRFRFAGQVTPTPTLITQPGISSSLPGTQPGISTPTTAVTGPVENSSGTAGSFASPLQQLSDQIGAVSQQVAQAVQDPLLSVDSKVQQINTLAARFNDLVAQWQQQLPPSATQPPAIVGVAATPTAPLFPSATPRQSDTTTNRRSPAVGALTADQLRARIVAVSQQMGQVAQDPSLTTDAKNAQLAALGAQFNQLMMQLQQLGG